VTIQQDYWAKLYTSTASHWRSLDFDRVLNEYQFTLFVREVDPERWEERFAEEQAQDLYSSDGRDLSVELEKLCEHVAGVENERAAEAEQLSWSVREISDALVDLDMFPIRNIPSQPRSSQDLLMAAGLVSERLQEEHASSVDPPV
jgi:hypothetical protein